jgi:hypothetical protein
MALTRFYDRQSGENGPVIGALQVLPFMADTAVTASADKAWELTLPAGMAFRVTDAVVNTGTVVGTVVVDLGTTAAGTEIGTTTLAATGTAFTQTVTISSTYTAAAVSAAGTISVRVTAAAGESAALPFSVNVIGYVTQPPTTVLR